jgi:hypothetical protein
VIERRRRARSSLREPAPLRRARALRLPPPALPSSLSFAVNGLPSFATILISQPISEGSALMRLISAAPRDVDANSFSRTTLEVSRA